MRAGALIAIALGLVLAASSPSFSQTSPRTVADLVKGAYGLTTFPITVRTDFACASTPFQIAKNDPTRFEDLFINTCTGSCYVDHGPTVTATSGVVLTPSGGSYVENWRDDLFMQTLETWAVCAVGATGNMHVIENKVQ